jgi:hypothetical protein
VLESIRSVTNQALVLPAQVPENHGREELQKRLDKLNYVRDVIIFNVHFKDGTPDLGGWVLDKYLVSRFSQ